MKVPRRQFLHRAGMAAAVAALAVILSGDGAWSQTTRTIKIVVPAAPGGTLDILARLLAEQIGRAQGRTMIIENRTGAAQIIGTEAVSRAAPDGNTLLITSNTFVISPHLRKVNYNPLASFEPICNVASSPIVIVVNSASRYRTLADLLNAARAKPGELTMASFGPANTLHIAVETLKRAANVNMTYIPYPGGAPAIIALLGEHVTSVIDTYPAAVEQLKASKLRALATASRTRIEPLPDVPTIAESGYKDYEAEAWVGLVAPAKTPKETVSQLAGWFTAALQVPEFKAKLAMQGLYPVGMCGEDFGAFIRKQYDDYGRAIREANIKAE
jgi:tripartite-type tricarboxylate transporter receptor subunit TctC